MSTFRPPPTPEKYHRVPWKYQASLWSIILVAGTILLILIGVFVMIFPPPAWTQQIYQSCYRRRLSAARVVLHRSTHRRAHHHQPDIRGKTLFSRQYQSTGQQPRRAVHHSSSSLRTGISQHFVNNPRCRERHQQCVESGGISVFAQRHAARGFRSAHIHILRFHTHYSARLSLRRHTRDTWSRQTFHLFFI